MSYNYYYFTAKQLI